MAKIKLFCPSKDALRKWKSKPKPGKNFSQVTYLTKDSYPEYMKNAYKWALKGKNKTKTKKRGQAQLPYDLETPLPVYTKEQI